MGVVAVDDLVGLAGIREVHVGVVLEVHVDVVPEDPVDTLEAQGMGAHLGILEVLGVQEDTP